MKTASVIGSGIAGLAAAKALQDRYKVKVISPRLAPQGDHLHVLLGAGQEQLEKLFPGILAKLKAAGAPEIDWALNTTWETGTGLFPKYNSGVRTLSFGRRLLEALMKEDLRCEFIEGTFTGFADYSSDLIVLAPGANFPLEKYVSAKVVDELPINLTYKSTVLKSHGEGQYYYQIDPPFCREGKVICPIEGEQMMVTTIVNEARPSGGYRKKSTFRRRVNFDELPRNVYLLGDVLTSLNPIFGQGMTVGLLQAGLLQQSLDPETFHAAAARIARLPFLLSHIGSRESGALKFFLRKFLRLCQCSSRLHYRFLKFLHYDSFTSVSRDLGPY